VGDDDSAAKLVGENTRVVDLQGKTVIPGLFDNHLHFSSCGAQLSLPLIYYQTKEVIFNSIGSHQEFRARCCGLQHRLG
jgi:predicted amidohydrolase YtcJ